MTGPVRPGFGQDAEVLRNIVRGYADGIGQLVDGGGTLEKPAHDPQTAFLAERAFMAAMQSNAFTIKTLARIQVVLSAEFFLGGDLQKKLISNYAILSVVLSFDFFYSGGVFHRRILFHVLALVPSWLGAEVFAVPTPIETRAVAADRVASLPDYAKQLPVNWLEAGVDLRNRFELRDQDYRTADVISDEAFFTRYLAYVGVREVLDPFRLSLELEDSRRFFSERPENPNEINRGEVLQAYGELYFDEWRSEQPVSVRAGRMTFDAVDRRLVTRNRYRNTINAYDGLRVRLGEEESPFELDAFSLRPVARDVSRLDRSSNESWLHAVTGYFREWSPVLIVEPYWILSDQTIVPERHIHTVGVHVFGRLPDSGWDYDGSVAAQGGRSAGLRHQAWAGHAEMGYTWDHPWKPRLAGWMNFASGDADPDDERTGRFDSLYGATFSFYGYTGYFSWQNLIDPSIRFSFQPTDALRGEIIHRAYWLASQRDAWVRTGRVDPSGGSGSYVGQEIDLRIAYRVNNYLDLEAVSAHFFPGGFAEETGSGPDSHFGYLQASIRF